MASVDLCLTGIGCRLPGGVRSPADLSRFLHGKGDGIVDLHMRRWNAERFYNPTPGRAFKTASRWGGLIDGIDRFDAEFFGMASNEAEAMDPQQRVLLQTAWEAMQDAGLGDDPALRERIGVFAGVSTHDYTEGQVARLEMTPPSPFTAVGQGTSIVANRISHAYDLGGPSVAVDTACSSSLVALHLAALAIANGDCDVALVGGVNIIVLPHTFLAFSAASMLSPDGRCKAFDARANGFVRAEGAGVVVIRRTADALADGDKIYARIMATGSNQDAQTRGITLPSKEAQAALSEATRRRAGLEPADIAYIEAHGTGTAVGDPIEATALGEVYGRDRSEPVLVGSIKTNVGHLEAGAGVAGLIKLSLALSERKVPPNLHFETPNPAIDFDGLGIKVVGETSDLGTSDEEIFGAINSFGFGGANAHAILASPPSPAPGSELNGSGARLMPLVLSARTEQGLQNNAARMRDFIAQEQPASHELRRSALARQAHHPLRLSVTGDDNEQLVSGLDDFIAERGSGDSWLQGEAIEETEAGPVFVYAGQGPQWWAMGRELYEREPLFRETIDACAQEQEHFGGWDLLAEFLSSEDNSRMAETAIAQPCIFALQAGLTQLLKSEGIEPAAVVGHSVGEVASAWASGALDLADACRVIYERGQAMDMSEKGGAMVSLPLSRQDAMALPEVIDGTLEIAALNGSNATVLAGYEKDVERLEERLTGQGLRPRRLPVRYAFHSRLMDPSQGPLVERLAGIEPRIGKIPLASTVTGNRVEGTDLTVGYWWNNIRRPVRFHRAISGLIRRGHRAFVEVSPHPVLTGEITRTLRAEGATRGSVAVGTLRREKDETIEMQRTVGALHAHGWKVGADRPGSPRDWVRLPTYGWDEQRYWSEAATSSRFRNSAVPHPLLAIEVPASEPTWRMPLDPRNLPLLNEHVLAGRIMVPATFFVELAAGAARTAGGTEGTLVLSDVHMKKALSYTPGEDAVFVQVRAKDGEIRLSSAKDVEEIEFQDHMTARYAVRETVPPERVDVAALRERCTVEADFDYIYSNIEKYGLSLGPLFRCAREGWIGPKEAICRISVDSEMREGLEGMILPPPLFDSVGHILGDNHPVLMPDPTRNTFYPPSRYDEIRIHRPIGFETWCWVKVNETGPFRISVDAVVFDEDGNVSVEIRGYELLCAAPLSEDAEKTPFDRNHEIVWRRDVEHSTREGAWNLCDALAGSAEDAPGGFEPWLEELWDLLKAGDADAFGKAWQEALRKRPEGSVQLALLASLSEALPQLASDTKAAHALLEDATTAAYLAATTADDRQFEDLQARLKRAGSELPDGWKIRVLDLTFDYGASAWSAVHALGDKAEVTALCSSAVMTRAATEVAAAPNATPRFLELADFFESGADKEGKFDLLICDPEATGDLVDLERIAGEFGAPGCVRIAKRAGDGMRVELSKVRLAGLSEQRLDLGSDGKAVAGWDVEALDIDQAESDIPALEPEVEPASSDRLVLVGQPEVVEPFTASLPDAAKELVTVVPSHGEPLQACLGADGEQGSIRVVDLRALSIDKDGKSEDQLGLELLTAIQGSAQDVAEAVGAGQAVHYTVATAGAYGGDMPGEGACPAQAAILGFVRSVSATLPDADCRMIDCPAEVSAEDLAMLAEEIVGAQDGEDLVALRGASRFLARLVPCDQPTVTLDEAPDRKLELMTRAPGLLDQLALRDAERVAPAEDEVEIAVEAAALNFRDVLKALRLYPVDAPDALLFGDECAGTVTRVGAGVTQFAPGDRVIASANGALASHVITAASRVAPLPAGIDPAAGSGLIVPYVTAYCSLIETARIRAGDKVLIHAGAGGVGLAAIQIAQAAGAEVFATAGSSLKRSFLRAMGVEHVFDSRSSTFVDGVLAATSGRGVDVVVNSLSGDLLHASFEVLAPGAHFIELGKRDIEEDTPVGLRRFRKGLSYTALDLSRDAEGEQFAKAMRYIAERIEAGELTALPYRTFALEDAVEAFAAMSRGAHLGKIVLTADSRDLQVPVRTPPAPAFNAERPIVVTGGLRGFGMRTARWLVANGARKIALVGLSGKVPADQQEHVEEMRRAGAEIVVLGADLRDRQAVTAMLAQVREQYGPIGGIVHAAATYSDRLLHEETAENLALVFEAKASSAWTLHEATADDPVDLFMMFSSVSAVLGSVGQTGYAGANAFLNGLARLRTAKGLPATVVDLDPIGDAGFLERNERVAGYLKTLGFEGLSSAEVLDSIGIAVADQRTETIVTSLDWSGASLLAGQGGTMPLLRELTQGALAETTEGATVREQILSAAPADRLPATMDYLRGEIARILRRPEDQIGDNQLLEELGLDSLSMVELVLRLETELAVSLPSSLIMMSPSISAVSKVILHQLTSSSSDEAADLEPEAGDLGKRFASEETLQADAKLAEQLDYGLLGLLPAAGAPLSHVLVTGATGMVGSALVADLIRNTDARITCLVRAETGDAAEARLLAAVQQSDKSLGAEDIRRRCNALVSDLSAPMFGLDPDAYDALAHDVTDVFHIGADVNHLLPYALLRATNVAATLEVLQFALTRSVKRVHHASSIAIFCDGDVDESGVVQESSVPMHPQNLGTPYQQTKWVAEALVSSAAEMGLPVTIHRIGFVVDEDESAPFDEESLYWRILQAAFQMEAVPDTHFPLYLVGRRFTAEAMRRIAQQAELNTGPYCIVGADGGTLEDFAQQVAQMSIVPVDEWLVKFVQAGLIDPDSPLGPYFQAAMQDQDATELPAPSLAGLKDLPDRFDRSNLDEVLASAGVTELDVTSFLKRSASHFQSSPVSAAQEESA